MLAGHFALVIAALFAGAAIYITVAEQPARAQLDAAGQLEEWKPSYRRAAAMQAPLALIGALAGLAAWGRTGDWQWGLGALTLAANWPYTFLLIMPINRRLLATDPAQAGAETRALIDEWGRLHVVRSTLGFAAVTIFFWASLR